jgi:hypothetical protein
MWTQDASHRCVVTATYYDKHPRVLRQGHAAKKRNPPVLDNASVDWWFHRFLLLNSTHLELKRIERKIENTNQRTYNPSGRIPNFMKEAMRNHYNFDRMKATRNPYFTCLKQAPPSASANQPRTQDEADSKTPADE